MMHISGVYKFGEWYQITNKTEQLSHVLGSRTCDSCSALLTVSRSFINVANSVL
jgi:hypothetical protein